VSERKIRAPVPVKEPEEVYRIVKRYAKSKQEQFIIPVLDHVIFSRSGFLSFREQGLITTIHGT
jgi:DNA repair protein RadC